jgi:hypothetical protein
MGNKDQKLGSLPALSLMIFGSVWSALDQRASRSRHCSSGFAERDVCKGR